MIPSDRLQQLLERKDGAEAREWCRKNHYSESWSIIDGALVVFDSDDPPGWLDPVLEDRDEDGHTSMG